MVSEVAPPANDERAEERNVSDRMMMLRRFLLGPAVTVALVVGTPLASVNADAPGLPVPDGYRVAARAELAAGVEHVTLTRTGPAQAVHIARIAPGAPVALRAVLSNDAVAEPGPRLERTSSMCARVRCIAAVNADFAMPGTDEPVGGVVSLGELQRSPAGYHHQLVVGTDGRLEAGPVTWKGKLVGTDLSEIGLAGLNTVRGPDGVVAYTPRFGPSTGTGPSGAEMVLRIVEPAGPLWVGRTSLVTMTSYGSANTPIPADGIVLSGAGGGAAALQALWEKVQSGAASPQALLRVETNPSAAESVGGTPVLVRDGTRWFGDDPTPFVRSRHPRTIAGWTPDGTVLLVTVDGRQPGYAEGMTLGEAADLMLTLGATQAINLDGGGSTTFVAGGAVVNRPSDRLVRRRGAERIVQIPSRGDVVVSSVERPVVVALVIVPATVASGQNAVARSGQDAVARAPSVPTTVALAPPATDDASQPHPQAALPALVAGATSAPPKLPAAAAALAILALAAALVVRPGHAFTEPS